jgi:hypothetical protein
MWRRGPVGEGEGGRVRFAEEARVRGLSHSSRTCGASLELRRCVRLTANCAPVQLPAGWGGEGR